MQNIVHSAFFRELYGSYSFSDIRNKLELTDEQTKTVLKTLRSSGIVKVLDKDNKSFDLERLQTEDFITEDITLNSSVEYVFAFVGIAYAENCVIKCYPKYIEDAKVFNEGEKGINHFKKVLRVLEKYNNSKEQNLKYFDQNHDRSRFNLMEIELYLLRDYFENGIYTNEESVIETNGEGEIDWDRTINSTFAIIKDNKPYYVELQTINTQSNDRDYIKLLHEFIITQCSHHLGREGADILDLFDMENIDLSSLQLDDFGDIEYIRYRLENEIRNQFVTQKQNLLRVILSYVIESQSRAQESNFTFYGSNAYHAVWEKACAQVFNDVKDKSLGWLEQNGKLKCTPYLDVPKKTSLLEMIEKATWLFNDNVCKADETLEPDTISIEENKFHILDGKYYLIRHDKNKVYNQPGIQDIVKQFAYHKAYNCLLQFSDLTHVSNSFMIPKIIKENKDWESEKIKNTGRAELNLMQAYSLQYLCPVNVLELSPDYVYDNYLKNSKITTDLSFVNATEIIKTDTHTGFDWDNDFIPVNPNAAIVGTMRKTQMKIVHDNGIGSEFYFYFYRKIGNTLLLVQNMLPSCERLIVQNTWVNYMIQADVIRPEIENHIKIMTKTALDKLLLAEGFEKTSSESRASEYYVIKMKVTSFDTVDGLNEKIESFEENKDLSEFSPKVIMK